LSITERKRKRKRRRRRRSSRTRSRAHLFTSTSSFFFCVEPTPGALNWTLTWFSDWEEDEFGRGTVVVVVVPP
jgi:hypothetical protein